MPNPPRARARTRTRARSRARSRPKGGGDGPAHRDGRLPGTVVVCALGLAVLLLPSRGGAMGPVGARAPSRVNPEGEGMDEEALMRDVAALQQVRELPQVQRFAPEDQEEHRHLRDDDEDADETVDSKEDLRMAYGTGSPDDTDVFGDVFEGKYRDKIRQRQQDVNERKLQKKLDDAFFKMDELKAFQAEGEDMNPYRNGKEREVIEALEAQSHQFDKLGGANDFQEDEGELFGSVADFGERRSSMSDDNMLLYGVGADSESAARPLNKSGKVYTLDGESYTDSGEKELGAKYTYEDLFGPQATDSLIPKAKQRKKTSAEKILKRKQSEWPEDARKAYEHFRKANPIRKMSNRTLTVDFEAGEMGIEYIPRPYTTNGGVVVSHVKKGTQAEKAGVRKGHILLQVNGHDARGCSFQEVDSYFGDTFFNPSRVKFGDDIDGGSSVDLTEEEDPLNECKSSAGREKGKRNEGLQIEPGQYVVLSGAQIRQTPDFGGRRFGKLPSGSIVNILEVLENVDRIRGKFKLSRKIIGIKLEVSIDSTEDDSEQEEDDNKKYGWVTICTTEQDRWWLKRQYLEETNITNIPQKQHNVVDDEYYNDQIKKSKEYCNNQIKKSEEKKTCVSKGKDESHDSDECEDDTNETVGEGSMEEEHSEKVGKKRSFFDPSDKRKITIYGDDSDQTFSSTEERRRDEQFKENTKFLDVLPETKFEDGREDKLVSRLESQDKNDIEIECEGTTDDSEEIRNLKEMISKMRRLNPERAKNPLTKNLMRRLKELEWNERRKKKRKEIRQKIRTKMEALATDDEDTNSVFRDDEKEGIAGESEEEEADKILEAMEKQKIFKKEKRKLKLRGNEKRKNKLKGIDVSDVEEALSESTVSTGEAEERYAELSKPMGPQLDDLSETTDDSEAQKAKEIKRAYDAKNGDVPTLSSETEAPEDFYERMRDKYEKPEKKPKVLIRRLSDGPSAGFYPANESTPSEEVPYRPQSNAKKLVLKNNPKNISRKAASRSPLKKEKDIKRRKDLKKLSKKIEDLKQAADDKWNRGRRYELLHEAARLEDRYRTGINAEKERKLIEQLRRKRIEQTELKYGKRIYPRESELRNALRLARNKEREDKDKLMAHMKRRQRSRRKK